MGQVSRILGSSETAVGMIAEDMTAVDTIAEDIAISAAVTTVAAEIIDDIWTLIEGEYVGYKSDVDRWVQAQRVPSAPPCPACKRIAGISLPPVLQIAEDLKNHIKRGRCKNCGAKFVIMLDK